MKTIDERCQELLQQLNELLIAQDAAERRLRRFQWRHPILYLRWLQTPEGQRWKLADAILEGKTPLMF